MCVFQSCFPDLGHFWVLGFTSQECSSSAVDVEVARDMLLRSWGIVGSGPRMVWSLASQSGCVQDVLKAHENRLLTLQISRVSDVKNVALGLSHWQPLTATDSYTLNEKVDFGGTYFPSLPFGICQLDLFGGFAVYFRRHSFKAGRCLIASSLKFIGPL